MDNTPNPTNQPNPTGNDAPETPIPDTSTENTAQATPTEVTETVETSTVATPTEAAEVTTTTETITTPTTESVSSQTITPPTTTETPITPATPVQSPSTAQAPITTPSSSQTSPKKGGLPVGLIIGLAIGGVILFGAAVAAVIFLFFGGGKVDYEATYEAFDSLESSMDDLDYGDCYSVHSKIDSSYTSSSEYSDYITGCVEEFVALESATNEFAKTSGAKHDDNIKTAFDSFKSTLDSIYTKKSDLESQLSLYNTYHEFYLTIDNADSNVDSLREAITSAATLFEDTKNSALVEFAKGFHEKGLAYVRAIDDYRNGSGVSYSDVYDKMEEFTDYIEDNAPEVDEVTGLDFTKMNDLSSAYYDLYSAVRDAYYDHM